MPTEPHIPTLAEVVKAAVDAADPTGADELVTELLTRFEDRDEPASAVSTSNRSWPRLTGSSTRIATASV